MRNKPRRSTDELGANAQVIRPIVERTPHVIMQPLAPNLFTKISADNPIITTTTTTVIKIIIANVGIAEWSSGLFYWFTYK